jgi:oligopeptide transport system ATP-binding protein
VPALTDIGGNHLVACPFHETEHVLAVNA